MNPILVALLTSLNGTLLLYTVYRLKSVSTAGDQLRLTDFTPFVVNASTMIGPGGVVSVENVVLID